MALTRSRKAQNRVLRSWILQKATEKVPVETAYKKYCLEKGSDVMEYIEFEFWYYRFYGGDHDLDYDKDFAPKNRTFMDLPIHIFGKILQELLLEDQTALREVSESIRMAMNSIPIDVRIISFDGFYNELHFFYAYGAISWENTNGGCKMNYSNFRQRFQFGKSYIIQATNYLSIVFSNPALKVKTFFIRMLSYIDVVRTKVYVKYMIEALSTIPNKIHVETIRICYETFETLLNFMQFCEPRHLKTIEVYCRTISTEGISEIRDTLLPSPYLREICLDINSEMFDANGPPVFGFTTWDLFDGTVYEVQGTNRKFQVQARRYHLSFSLLEG